MKKVLVILVGALLLAAAMVVGTAAFLARSEAGTRVLAEQAERFLPVRFTGIAGNLWGALRVDRVVVEAGNRRVEIDGLALQTDLFPLLFENRLEVKAARAEAVRVSEPVSDAPEGPPAPLELPFMPIVLDVAELEVGRLELPAGVPLAVRGGVTWRGEGLEARQVTVESEVIELALEGELGSGANPSLVADVRWSLPGRDLSGSGRLEGRADEVRVRQRIRGLVSARVRGAVNVLHPAQPVLDVEVSLEDLLIGEAEVSAAQARIRGTLEALTAEGGARIAVPELEPFPVQVSAEGPVTGPVSLREVVAGALGGSQRGGGRLTWEDGLAVDLAGRAAGVDLAALRDGVEGQVDAAFELAYRHPQQVTLALEEITGTVNGRPLTGAMDIVRVTDGWTFDAVRLSAGGNRLVGSLTLREGRVEADATVAAPELESLGLGLAGDVSGQVRLSGRWPELDGRLALTSTALSAFDARLEDAVLEGRLDAGTLTAAASAAAARRGPLAMEQARLEARGPLEAVEWRLTWQQGESRGELRRGDQGLALNVAAARVAAFGQQWRLEEPARLLLADEGMTLGHTCIVAGEARGCIESFGYRAGRMDTQGVIDRVPVALLRPWLPAAFAEDGYLEGDWSVTGGPGDWRGGIRLDAHRLAYLPGPDQDPLPLPDLLTTASLEGDTLRVSLAALAEEFAVSGEGTLQPVAFDGVLDGRALASVSRLEPLEVFDQRIEELGGALVARLEVSGTPRSPRLEGRVELVDGAVALRDPGLRLTDMGVELQLDETGRFSLRGEARQRDDEVLLTASGTGLFRDDLAFQASLQGERVRVDHPDWEMRVSPDLALRYADGLGRLTGQVVVPQAEVRLKTLPTTVPRPSEDVVVVGREPEAAGAAPPIQADVELVLGEDVVLRALAATAELEGRLQARLDARGRTTLRGTLDVTGGVVSAQGQTLTIESGTVVYNGPVTRPYIDVRAVRVIEDATPAIRVGLRIRGDADNLTSSVFSEPPMAETRALSYLVLGRDFDEASSGGGDTGELAAAAINLGLSRSENIISDLRRATGLDELSATAETESSFAIVAGKRISDDLYVRYTYDTLASVGEFLLRYDLGRRWLLEARSGENSAMDLMYSFEK